MNYKYGNNFILFGNLCIPIDEGNRDYQQFLLSRETPAPADPPDLEAMVIEAVQNKLDQFARTRIYDGILSACTYATSKVPKFSKEAAYCVGIRDDTWAKCYEIMNDVLSGARPMPTVDEVLSELPVLEWPN